MTINKIKTLNEILKIIDNLKNDGKIIVTTNGCFDILHIGHVKYLQEAKKLGDVLIVGVNSDKSTRKIKGRGRPIMPVRERMEILAALESVDYIFPFDEPDPCAWLKKLKPNIHAKGGDYTMDRIIEKNAVEKSGGEIVLLKKINTKSTTDIIDIILKKFR
jgi:rfaE bifunctional protein nucleotidyltransferase chain/domain